MHARTHKCTRTRFLNLFRTNDSICKKGLCLIRLALYESELTQNASVILTPGNKGELSSTRQLRYFYVHLSAIKSDGLSFGERGKQLYSYSPSGVGIYSTLLLLQRGIIPSSVYFVWVQRESCDGDLHSFFVSLSLRFSMRVAAAGPWCATAPSCWLITTMTPRPCTRSSREASTYLVGMMWQMFTLSLCLFHYFFPSA